MKNSSNSTNIIYIKKIDINKVKSMISLVIS